jgi:hypothetical protein
MRGKSCLVAIIGATRTEMFAGKSELPVCNAICPGFGVLGAKRFSSPSWPAPDPDLVLANAKLNCIATGKCRSSTERTEKHGKKRVGRSSAVETGDV